MLVLSMVFAVRINKFESGEKSIIVSGLSLSKAERKSDKAYCTRLNQIFDSIIAFYNTILSTNIQSALDLSCTVCF